MKRILFLLLCGSFALTGYAQTHPNTYHGVTNDSAQTSTSHASQKKETAVYICDSKTAYAYHSNKNCSGLNRCTHDVKAVSKGDAVSVYGRRPCKICCR